jgi:hypothetical protein
MWNSRGFCCAIPFHLWKSCVLHMICSVYIFNKSSTKLCSHCLSQVVNKFVLRSLLTTCDNLVDIIGLVARLFQQVRSSHDITIWLVVTTLWHSCYIMTVSGLLEQSCNKSDNACHQACYKLLTACPKLVTATGNKQCEHNLSTACEQICNNIFADL